MLAKEGTKIFVVSNYALDCKRYNSVYTDVTWETCSIRKWLNDTFLNTAFSKEEQSKIQSVVVSVEKNPLYNTESGMETQDKVYLMSISEYNQYNLSKCQSTAFANAQGCHIDGNSCQWWLRSPGSNSSHAAIVNTDGSVSLGGYYVSNKVTAVRPVMWIDLG